VQLVNKTHEGYRLSAPLEVLKALLLQAPLSTLADPRFNANTIINSLDTDPIDGKVQKHIKILKNQGLNMHSEILHNLVHLGCILHQDIQLPAEQVAELLLPLLLPLFLPIFEVAEPTPLTDYLKVKHKVTALVQSPLFREPYSVICEKPAAKAFAK